MGVASMVLGILGVLLAINPWFFWAGLILSIIALVLGVVGRKQALRDGRPAGTAVAGMVLGIIGVAFGALIFALCASCAKGISDAVDEAEKQGKLAPSSDTRPRPTAQLGETVTFSDSKWVVKEATVLKSVKTATGGAQTSGGRFIRVVFTITNTSKQSEMLFVRPKLVAPDDREWQPNDATALNLAPHTEDLTAADIPVGLPKTYSLVYEVPADATGLFFVARELAAAGATQKVALGL